MERKNCEKIKKVSKIFRHENSNYVTDFDKGSMYANPQFDNPVSSENLIKKYPQDYSPNLWPKDDLPELEQAFKKMGCKMISVGEHLAFHCDLYIKSKLPSYSSGLLENLIKSSRTAKGRLLHYYAIYEDGQRDYDSWCGWHNDHSALTALTSAFFTHLDSDKEVSMPDADCGLYIRTRQDEIVKASIPKDCIAFQIGETSQILSGGILRATPHAVRAPKYPESSFFQRDTFAVFMQPNHDQKMVPPEGVPAEKVSVGKWIEGQTYSEFSKGTLEGNYDEILK